MTARELICACEDVSRAEVEAAIAEGHRDLESVKRVTGLGTGFCQGRCCLVAATRLLAAQGADRRVLAPSTIRPPVSPVSFATLAAGHTVPPLYPTTAPEEPTPRPPPRDAPPLPHRAQVAIVGGGIMGLGLAHHLAELGMRDVVVLERGYLNAGASGRNEGGVRAQFASELNVTLMQESIRLCRRFAKDYGINVWLRQGGYLFLARQREVMDTMAQSASMQNRLGLRTRVLSAREAAGLVSGLRTDDLVGATFNPEDGVIFPWPFLWGYADAARRRGVHIATFTPVTNLLVEGGRVTGVHTNRGLVRADLVVNATAAWAPQLARMVGLELPNQPVRHEILATESLEPCVGPLVAEMESGFCFAQSLRGEIVTGMGDPEQPVGLEMRSSLRFAVRLARAMVHRMPSLAQLRVLRQWAGCYDVTPDRRPILGEVDQPKGFYQLHGFVGHGFMMAPAVTRIVAAHIAKGASHPLIEQHPLARFEHGGAAPETMIIG